MSRATFTPPRNIVEVEILAAECDACATVALALTEDDFGRPTRCEAWDVRALGFADRSRAAVRAAAARHAGRLVRTFGPSLHGSLCTRLLEVSVHGLDLADAVGRGPWITPDAVAVVGSMLVGLLGAERPAEPRWSDLEFIEIGTGRRRRSAHERAALGALADRFPLLA